MFQRFFCVAVLHGVEASALPERQQQRSLQFKEETVVLSRHDRSIVFYAQQFKNPNGYEAGYYEGTLANSKGVEETDEVVNAWMTVEADGDKWLIINVGPARS